MMIAPFGVSALLPIAVLIGLGAVLFRTVMANSEHWRGLERVSYYVLMPCLLVANITGFDAGLDANLGTDLGAALHPSDAPDAMRGMAASWVAALPWVGATLLITGVLITAYALSARIRRHTSDYARFTSYLQGNVRFNQFITLALAENMLGKAGLLMTATGVASLIIACNMICVAALAYGAPHAEHTNKRALIRTVALNIVKNPLILASMAALTLNALGITLPTVAADSLALIGRAALPIGLMCVGAALKFGHLGGEARLLAASCAVQFWARPTLVGLIALPMTGAPVAFFLAVCLCVPTAPSAYVLARSMGGDARTMASLISVQTVAAFAAIPACALWLQYLLRLG